MDAKYLKISKLPNLMCYLYTNNNKYLDLSSKDLAEMFKRPRRKLQKIWDNREHDEDFSVYHEPAYMAEAISCYINVSSNCINHLTKYLNKIGVDISELTLLDDYNGCGLSSILAVTKGFKKVYYFNDSKVQKKLIDDVCELVGIKAPIEVNETERFSKTYDIVCSFEVAEHIKEPIPYIKTAMRASNKYLCYSSGFGSNNELQVGHYLEYIANGKKVSPRTISRRALDFIKNDFELKEVGWNRKPLIFERRS